MLTVEDIHKIDYELKWSEHPFSDQERVFYQGILDTFYRNPACFVGIFTGNDLDNFHQTCLFNEYKVDAYDYYPYFNDSDKNVMKQYVINRHSDKPYINFCWSDATKSSKQYSFIYNTAGYSCKIHELFNKQESPCILLNSRGSSWGLHSTGLFTYVFRSNNFDIFVNCDEAKNLFHNYLKSNFVKFQQIGFDIVRIDKTLYGYLRHTNDYKKFIKTFSSVDTKKISI